jgi:hypothetical protein
VNYDSAKQLADGSGWHYGTANRRTGVWPLGYCQNHGGHPTELEARECYSQYQRDNIVFDHGTWSWTGCMLPGCDNPTKSAARVQGNGFSHAALCDEHLNLEDAAVALDITGPAHDSWHS